MVHNFRQALVDVFIRRIELFEDKIKPQTWLTIYGIALFVLLIFLMFSWESVSKQTKDLPYAIRQEHVTVTGEVEKIRYSGGRTASQLCTIDNIDFNITHSAFLAIKEGETYTIAFLPNTKFIIDVFDENGRSLLKN